MQAMAAMGDNAYDLAIVDPPYGIERFQKPAKGSRFFMDKQMHDYGLTWDKKPEDVFFSELFRVSKFQIIWGGNNFLLPPSEYFIIWDKKQPVENFASAEYAWTNIKRPAKVFEFSIHKHNKASKIHPTQKPVALYKWLIKNYASEGDRILDTHLGSGSIAIACHDLGFDLEGYEIDQEYHQAALGRLNTHRSQLQIF